jgi:hypothetical protein
VIWTEDALKDSVKNSYISYSFYTPIPAIADTLKPVVEVGGLNIPG